MHRACASIHVMPPHDFVRQILRRVDEPQICSPVSATAIAFASRYRSFFHVRASRHVQAVRLSSGGEMPGSNPSDNTVHLLWLNAGLSCDGDSVSLTAATLPSVEDIVMGNI